MSLNQPAPRSPSPNQPCAQSTQSHTQKRHVARAASEPSLEDDARFSKDLTNTVGERGVRRAKRNVHKPLQVPFPSKSVIPFPVDDPHPCPRSPERPAGGDGDDRATENIPVTQSTPPLSSPVPPVVKRRRTLVRALAQRDTALIGETLHFESLSVYGFSGTVLNPGVVLEFLQGDVFYHIWTAVKVVIERNDRDSAELVEAAMEQFLVHLGKECMDRVSGPHLTFVDPRLHNDSDAIIRQAKRLVARFEEEGVQRDRIVLGIPATHAGLLAARKLERESIQTNVLMVAGMTHAAACAESGATLATIPVGPILDWYEKSNTISSRELAEHPGIKSIQTISEYFHINNVKTKIIGCNFRQLSEITALGGALDAVSLSESQVERWWWRKVRLAAVPLRATERAQKARYPSRLLGVRKDFMSAMPDEARRGLEAALHGALRRAKAEMDQLEAIVSNELDHHMGLANVDMTTLYRSWRAQQAHCPSHVAVAAAAAETDEESEEVVVYEKRKGAPPALEPDWFLDGLGQDIWRLFEMEDAEEAMQAALEESSSPQWVSVALRDDV